MIEELSEFSLQEEDFDFLLEVGEFPDFIEGHRMKNSETIRVSEYNKLESIMTRIDPDHKIGRGINSKNEMILVVKSFCVTQKDAVNLIR